MKTAIMLALIGLGAAAADASALKITIVTFGPAPPAVLEALQEGLAKELGAEVARGGEMPVPAASYGRERRQYLAETFLPFLVPYRQGPGELVLGVTAVDLYVPDLNFVFGLADPRIKCAVISLARLAPEFYGHPPDPRLFQDRTLKEAVHELGHLLGLEHCRQPSCIMFFSNTLADTDRKGPGFCPNCRGRLAGR
jgi:archaemetzincin